MTTNQAHNREADVAVSGRATAWLSTRFEHLIHTLQARAKRGPADYDVVIVGSGYGGAVAAASFAGAVQDGRKVSVCVLERGKEYLPGAFPSRLADLGGHVRVSTHYSPSPQGQREGLFDFRVGADVSALVASGLGGGSLINAGVMIEPKPAVLASLGVDQAGLGAFYQRARSLLGAAGNTIHQHAGKVLPLKFRALAALNEDMGQPPEQFKAAPITVAMNRKRNSAGVELDACTLCGDCATGCNFNAKDSLDTNLLVNAWRQGAEIFTGATVLRIERDESRDRWCLQVCYTDGALRKKQKTPFKLYARKVVLAAGTFGSTEILMRSRSDALQFSPMLGQRFSSNGDMLAVRYQERDEVNAVADENVAPAARGIGPTITGMIEVPGGAGQPALLIEEMAIPAPLRRLFEEAVTTAHTLYRLGMPDREAHTPDQDGAQDPCAVDAAAIRHSSVLAIMGDDGAAGRLELVGDDDNGCGDGGIRVRWPALRDAPLFDRQIAVLQAAPAHGSAAPAVLPNPVWKMLPDSMEYLLGGKRGPVTTVHPLGGCPIGEAEADGVVNQYGQVFRGAALARRSGDLYDSLLVLDGSIVRAALGVNPALTIAALSLRAAEAVRAAWGWSGADDKPVPARRPVFQLPACVPAAPTRVEFVERMAGPATLAGANGEDVACMVELTLGFDPVDIAALALPVGGAPVKLRRRLTVQEAKSSLRVYDAAQWQAWKKTHDGTAQPLPEPLLCAPLSGTLDFMHRESSTEWRRVARAGVPWLLNRGMRDFWQWFSQRRSEGGFFSAAKSGSGWREDIARRYRDALALASRGGEVRRFDYQLTIGSAVQGDGTFAPAACAGQQIAGYKRLTYGRASNPWNQLMRMTLASFPGLRGSPVLELDTGFLVRENMPLLRILSQQDQPTALADLAGLGGYLLRVLLNIHMWSFRKPDTPVVRMPQRLPGQVAGLPPPRITELEVDLLPNGLPVHVRLTHYARALSALPPVVMIHGYSASGTTFAHAAVNPNLASHLWKLGRDVWILDLRTSSGMPTARYPWSFEDAAHADIPAAIDHICRVTGAPKVDVVAHCMGGAMFGMAILGKPQPGDRFAAERERLPASINRLVLSQVGPLVVFSQSNIFRAYVMGYLRNLLPMLRYEFRIDGESSLADELVDRVLATLPYPDHEFRLENPLWPARRTPFVGTRHRMDALYGRDFSLANVDRPVLDNIDDFFGPLNMETVSQAIHFARHRTIANRAGRNVYVSRKNLIERWTFPTLSIHGEDNGLADVATLGRMKAVLEDAQRSFTALPLKGFGHQDCWIGRHAVEVFGHVAAFLEPGAIPAPAGAAADEPASAQRFIAQIPWAGPVRTGFASALDGAVRCPIGAATSQVMGGAAFVAFVPVLRAGARYRVWPGGQALRDSLALYAARPDKDGWLQIAPRRAPAGADGMLMFILYDAAAAMSDNAGYARRTAALPLAQYGPWNVDLMQSAEVQDLAGFPAILDQACGALEQALADTPAPALESGLIAFGAADAGAPAADAGGICFAVGSCQYPAGMLDQVPAFASYRRLARRLDAAGGAPKPGFIVLMGDQVYTDASGGLFDPTVPDDRYIRPYERLFANEDVKSVLRRLPAYMMLDDHEIANDWERDADPGLTDRRLNAGRRAYLTYQRTEALLPAAARARAQDRLWFTFESGPFPFFVADTRSERQARCAASVGRARIMSNTQFAHLLHWLRVQPPELPKFVVTPSILAPRRMLAAEGGHEAHRLRSDAWDGYPDSHHFLLAYIARHQIRNVVFLSGDEHISCQATLTVCAPRGKPVEIRSIHSSALYAPFPFANSSPADLMDSGDQFNFSFPRRSVHRYRCTVVTEFTAGDGLAIINVRKEAAGWLVDCQFERAAATAD